MPNVDSDGNETAGITLPEISVPLAAHTGWNLRHPDIGGETQPLMYAGATIPLTKSKDERGASGDPRLSISERYSSKGEYLARVKQAAESLVAERHLLEQDIDTCLAQAGKFWDRFA